MIPPERPKRPSERLPTRSTSWQPLRRPFPGALLFPTFPGRFRFRRRLFSGQQKEVRDAAAEAGQNVLAVELLVLSGRWTHSADSSAVIDLVAVFMGILILLETAEILVRFPRAVSEPGRAPREPRPPPPRPRARYHSSRRTA